MRRSSHHVILVLLSLTLTHCRLIQHQQQHRLQPYEGSRYGGGPDAEIESFMRQYNIRYPQQHVENSRNSVKDHPGLQYYYSYDDLPASLDSHGYGNPPHYENDHIQPETEHHLSSQPQDNIEHKDALEKEALEKVLMAHNQEKPKEQEPSIKQESPKIKVESRSSAGQVRANEVRGIGLPGALIQSDEDSRITHESSIADVYLLAVIAGCAVAAVSGLALTGVCWYRLHKRVKAASDVEYPAYGVTGPAKEKSGPPGDRKLAQSAQMYHYQHQKQQMIQASERLGPDQGGAGNGGGSEGESDEECEEGDYTVFECPGLATAGEMEVRNPLFNDQTPVATPATEK